MSSVFKAISDPVRREILEDLTGGPMAVHEIAERHLISRPAISRHLKVMRAAGVIDRRQEGKENIYFLNAEPLRDVRQWLDQFWAEKLLNLKSLSEGDT